MVKAPGCQPGEYGFNSRIARVDGSLIGKAPGCDPGIMRVQVPSVTPLGPYGVIR